MKIALLSPLPPARTGIAHYASMLLPALRQRAEVAAFDASRIGAYHPASYDAVIYQLGNNPQHEFVYRQAMRHPGVAVLHDVVLHHLVVEMTIARGDADAYVDAMRANHGGMGEAWARGRAIGLHDELANFLMPASVDLANRSRAVIVHNHYAARRLRQLGVRVPVHVVGHPYVPDRADHDRAALRARLGFASADRVIGLFGFLTSAKRGEVVVEAFRAARAADPRLKLLVVGEAAPNIDLRALEGEGVRVTGYVADHEFGDYYSAADRLVNLRYPSAGETSGTLVRAFDAGKPVAVSDYAQFAELPDDCVVKVPFGPDELPRLTQFFLGEVPSPAAAQRRWLEENARLDRTVDGYMAAVLGEAPVGSLAAGSGGDHPAATPLSLFPSARFSARRTSTGVCVTVTNLGETLRAAEYGQPGYRIIVKLFDGQVQVLDRWMALPRDLRRGEAVEIEIPFVSPATRLTLAHALEGVPLLDTAAAEVELGGV